jgi:DnaJ homolog subfamily C member 9
MRIALLYHPDKKGGNPELFRALSLVHSILSDPEKRSIYDETGDIDEGDAASSESEQHWNDYFRAMFPKISTADIEKFSEKYIGSDEEKTDVINAYLKYDGYFPHIMETVILAEDEDRLCGLIDEAIAQGRIKTTAKYSAFVASRKPKSSSKKNKKSTNNKTKKDAGAGLESLESMILNKRSKHGDDIISSLLSKYGSKSSRTAMEDDIPDDEFAAIQSRIMLKR